ncbi:MAG: ParA family protein [Candidatus Limnocylindrales bacterium]
MGETIACANQKGGVGKTTTVVNLATYLALAGRSVLVVDLYPQGNATSGFGIERGNLERSAYDVITGEAPIAELVVETGISGLRILPSAMALAGAEVELAAMAQRERQLARAMAPLGGVYEHVFIDCPPSLGLLTVNALTAADAVLIPIQCEYYALEGLNQLIATINLVRDHLNPQLAIKGVLLTMYDARTNLAADVADEVRRHLGPRVFQTLVPRSVRLSEAPSYGMPIALYRPDSRGASAYRAVADEYLRRDGLNAAVATSRTEDLRA